MRENANEEEKRRLREQRIWKASRGKEREREREGGREERETVWLTTNFHDGP